jgi:hypothetical protein
MEIPLSLKKSADGRLSYGIPLWYRIVTAAMLLLIAGGIFTTGGSPSLVAWIILALLLLGLVYEERWVVDPQAKVIRHIGGLWPIARPMTIEFDLIKEFCLRPLARGTVPGSKEESSVNAKAFDMMNHKDTEQGFTKGFFKSASRVPYINLLMLTKDDEAFLVDSLPARRAERLRKAGQILAAASGSRFAEPNV